VQEEKPMWKLCISSVLFLFLTWEPQPATLSAWGSQDLTKIAPKPEITPETAQKLEEGLKTNPDNLAAREQLLKYYFQAMVKSRSIELEKKRERHILWLIEHAPDSQLAGSPEAEILPVGISGSTDAYEQGKQLWLAQVQDHPGDARILANAAQFLLLSDRNIARDLLQKALNLDPSNSLIATQLAQTYDLERMMTSSSEEKAALAQKALSIRERSLENTGDEQRFDELGDVAKVAFDADDLVKAGQYASELLQDAPKYKKSWNYGNAIHTGNIILGRIALRRGDVPGADQYLLAAGATPGSPQLDSFGPNMSLAKELLEKGERDTVLAYLQSCTKFWQMGGTKLQGWIATVKGGGAPDFSSNLNY